jgi:probable DNA metabolism protein
MSGIGPSVRPVNAIYLYDGSFDGFLCCVFESIYSRELPVDILVAEDAPLTLLDVKEITTDGDKAKRVYVSIAGKISKRALDLVRAVFLSCLPQKESKLLAFLRKAYKEGGRLLDKLGDPIVVPLIAAERRLFGEATLLRGFVRFSDVGEGLVAKITPQNYILPLIAPHFILRYREENFVIYDQTNKAALVHKDRRSEIIRAESVQFPDFSEKEERYRSLWKQFYNTVAIEGRENPRCRMSKMPKRYWTNMAEVEDLL